MPEKLTERTPLKELLEKITPDWEIGWRRRGLTGPNMAAFCVYDFKRNNVEVLSGRGGANGDILVAVVPMSENPANLELILKAPALARSHEAMRKLLIESQEFIGGDWRERRDAVLAEAGKVSNG